MEKSAPKLIEEAIEARPQERRIVVKLGHRTDNERFFADLFALGKGYRAEWGYTRTDGSIVTLNKK